MGVSGGFSKARVLCRAVPPANRTEEGQFIYQCSFLHKKQIVLLETYLKITCSNLIDYFGNTSKQSSYNQFHNILRLFDVLPKFSFRHKWNDGRLLLINMVYRSCLKSSRTTWDGGSYEIGKYQESV